MKHDLIFVERTCRWVCKCGKAGHLKSDMLIHQKEIDAEALSPDVQNERVENLIKDVQNA